jgi:hypothetical protein
MLILRGVIRKLEELSAFGIPSDEYTVSYGAALVMHGIKSHTQDVDVKAVPALMDRMVSLGFGSTIYRGQRMIHLAPGIDLFEVDVIPESTFIEGHPVMTIGAVREEKFERGREKDLEDVKMIDAHLSLYGNKG